VRSTQIVQRSWSDFNECSCEDQVGFSRIPKQAWRSSAANQRVTKHLKVTPHIAFDNFKFAYRYTAKKGKTFFADFNLNLIGLVRHLSVPTPNASGLCPTFIREGIGSFFWWNLAALHLTWNITWTSYQDTCQDCTKISTLLLIDSEFSMCYIHLNWEQKGIFRNFCEKVVRSYVLVLATVQQFFHSNYVTYHEINYVTQVLAHSI
jgi:hypothetical protein